MAVMITIAVKIWAILSIIGIVVGCATGIVTIVNEDCNRLWNKAHDVAVNLTFILIGIALGSVFIKALVNVWGVI